MARPREDVHLLRKIAVAVFELVAIHGVDGASMRRVAARTGVSTGTLNYHFRNKDGLVLAAVDYAYYAPAGFAEQVPDVRRSLEQLLLTRYVLRTREVRAWWRFFCAVTAHAPRSRAIARRQTKRQRGLLAFFEGVLRAGIRRGQLRADLDPRREAARLVAFGHGLAIHQLLDPSRAATDRAARLFVDAVATLA